jgi:hypothetical protein
MVGSGSTDGRRFGVTVVRILSMVVRGLGGAPTIVRLKMTYVPS